MKFLIIEDEPPAAERLILLLKNHDPHISQVPVCESVEQACNWLMLNENPDCIFMDIQLSDGLCFGIADKIQINCPVIFTTAYEDYALKAYELYSIDYLLKPITQQKLNHALQKLKQFNTLPYFNQSNISSSKKEFNNKFVVKLGNKYFFIDSNQIAFFNADDKTVYLNTFDGNRFIIDFTLDKIMEQIDHHIFFRPNRKIITRMNAIKEIKSFTNRRLTLNLKYGENNTHVIVSRDRVAAFKEWAKTSF